jgi:hypothetical protein
MSKEVAMGLQKALNITQDSLCPVQYLEQVPHGHKSETLLHNPRVKMGSVDWYKR